MCCKEIFLLFLVQSVKIPSNLMGECSKVTMGPPVMFRLEKQGCVRFRTEVLCQVQDRGVLSGELSGLSFHSRPIYSITLHNGYLLVNMYPACAITEICGGVKSFPCQGTVLQISRNTVSAIPPLKKKKSTQMQKVIGLSIEFKPWSMLEQFWNCTLY